MLPFFVCINFVNEFLTFAKKGLKKLEIVDGGFVKVVEIVCNVN